MSRFAHRTLRARVVVVGLLAVCGAPVAAQSSGESPGRVGALECCTQLLFAIGARAAGLGNALTARSGADAMFVNPASLAKLERAEFRIHNAPTDLDEVSNTFSLAFGIRTAGTLAISYRLVDYGDVEATDDDGNPTGSIRILDQVLLASFATRMAPGLSAGVTYKLFQFRQDCSGICGEPGFAATTHGIDAGVQYHPTVWPALQLGVAIVHAGLPLQVINAAQASPMPTRVRVGAAYEVMRHFTADTTTALWTTLDVSGLVREGVEQVVGVGLELILDRTIFIRTGYSTASGGIGGAAVGVGLRYDRFDVGISKSFVASPIGGKDPFQVTFAIGF